MSSLCYEQHEGAKLRNLSHQKAVFKFPSILTSEYVAICKLLFSCNSYTTPAVASTVMWIIVKGKKKMHMKLTWLALNNYWKYFCLKSIFRALLVSKTGQLSYIKDDRYVSQDYRSKSQLPIFSAFFCHHCHLFYFYSFHFSILLKKKNFLILFGCDSPTHFFIGIPYKLHASN